MILSSYDEVVFSHVCKGANSAAHVVAHHWLHQDQSETWCSSLPVWLQRAIEKDNLYKS